jgi:membrane protein DedA with SNARE-associated domain
MPRLDSFDRHLATIQPLLGEWGYLAVFVFIFIEGIGIPAPGQTLLMAGALLASRGELALGPLVATALAAAALGNAAGFEIGRRGGRPLLLRFARGDRLARVEAVFRRSDATLVLLGRFVDGARQLNGIAAGALGMDGQRFLTWNLLGAALWSFFWGIGTWIFGRDLDAIARTLHVARPVLLLVVPTATALLLGWLLWRRGRPGPQPG